MVDMRLILCLKLLIEHRILLLKHSKLCLSLRLLHLSHRVPTAKLASEAHSLRIPSKVPHCLGDVGETSREHGTKVRCNNKINWKSHDASTLRARFRDKAQGPPYSNQPHRQLSVFK